MEMDNNSNFTLQNQNIINATNPFNSSNDIYDPPMDEFNT